jgi:signal transduction histidine kinase
MGETMQSSCTPVSVVGAGEGSVLSLSDEIDLRSYFGAARPPMPGVASVFGAMCERLGNARNPKTTEQPTPSASWTEILDCPMSFDHGTTNATEDAMIAYIDGQRRVARVHRVVSRLEHRDRIVLEAHYGGDVSSSARRPVSGVAALTETAEWENRARAARDLHESVEESLIALRAEARDRNRPRTQREGARARLQAIRREAGALLDGARASYARARLEARR